MSAAFTGAVATKFWTAVAEVVIVDPWLDVVDGDLVVGALVVVEVDWPVAGDDVELDEQAVAATMTNPRMMTIAR